MFVETYVQRQKEKTVQTHRTVCFLESSCFCPNIQALNGVVREHTSLVGGAELNDFLKHPRDSLTLIPTRLPGHRYYYHDLTVGNSVSERLRNLLKVTQLMCGRGRRQTQITLTPEPMLSLLLARQQPPKGEKVVGLEPLRKPRSFWKLLSSISEAGVDLGSNLGWIVLSQKKSSLGKKGSGSEYLASGTTAQEIHEESREMGPHRRQRSD